MRNFIAKYGGQGLRKVFWQMVKGEHPDAIMLRLLRARKWNVDRAVAVLGSTVSWRVENNVEEIVSGGELELTSTRGGMNILRNGISYIYGATATGEPVYLIEVGRHFSASQTQDELKRAVILLQETLASVMPPPIERKVVIFNMNEFGVRNMDWWCVFFMVKTMECFYVETLARVYVHGAPWIFKPIWSILKPLLDPVVRDKIRLTSDPRELAEYIPLDHLTKGSMKAEMDWTFEYPLPQPDENDLQKDTASRGQLQEDYFVACFELERATRAVARVINRNQSRTARPAAYDVEDDAASSVGGTEYDEPPELASLKAKRDVLATKLRVAWLKLAPYQVGKTKLHRWNVVQPDGTIVWKYNKLDGSVETQVLGEATSLPALERNLAAIEGREYSQTTEHLHTCNGLQGSSPARRISSNGSKTSSEVRGPNGNKKSSSRISKMTETSDATSNGVLAKETQSPETRPSTSGSSSGLSHPSDSSAFHSMSTIHPRNPLTSAAVATSDNSALLDTPASSVHPLDEELANPVAPSMVRKGTSEAEIPLHPLDAARPAPTSNGTSQ